ncbi:MAG: hypothetical protein WAQ57_00790 [Candidatus Saccharimonadales bacterium]
MKQQDIAALIGVVGVASIISYFLVANIITPSDKKQSAEVVAEISSSFAVPDSKIFNAESINPTRRIEIAPNTNSQPFSQTQ